MLIHVRQQCPAGSDHSLRRARLRARPAFSLIELAIVLVLMGIVVAIAAPRWQASVDRHRAELAARRVASEIELARTRALQQGRPWVVRAESMSSTLEIAAAGDASTSSSINLGLDPLRATLGQSTFDRDANFVFDAFGAPPGDGKVQVQSGSMAVFVTVRAISGYVEVGSVFYAGASTLLLSCVPRFGHAGASACASGGS